MTDKRTPSANRRTNPTRFDPDEQQIANRIMALFESATGASAFGNAWRALVFEFYRARKLTDVRILDSKLHRMGETLEDKLKLRTGTAAVPDYRDDLLEISKRFSNRREFCEAAGISEDMLSHVIHSRKDFSIRALSEALGRIGYRIVLAPIEENR